MISNTIIDNNIIDNNPINNKKIGNKIIGNKKIGNKIIGNSIKNYKLFDRILLRLIGRLKIKIINHEIEMIILNI